MNKAEQYIYRGQNKLGQNAILDGEIIQTKKQVEGIINEQLEKLFGLNISETELTSPKEVVEFEFELASRLGKEKEIHELEISNKDLTIDSVLGELEEYQMAQA